jgi:succinyl-CoA synthetase alpha subunit
VIAGTNFVDALKVFEHDDDTKAIIIVGELGGTTEEEAADWITNYRKRVKNPKPIAAVIGGFQAPHGKVMGHAGAWIGLGEGTAESKYRALENAGVTMVDHPAKFGGVMKDILAKPGRNVSKPVRSLSPMDKTRTLTIDRSNWYPNSVAHTTLHASHAGLSHLPRRLRLSDRDALSTSQQTSPPAS